MANVKEKYNHWLPPLIGAEAVTLGHTILYTDSFDNTITRTRKHELKHVEQIDKLGIFWFYLNYLMQYLNGRRKGLGHWEAYEIITFEVEARQAEYSNKGF